MSHYPWSERQEALVGSPYPEVYIRNVRAQPLGDGNLKLLLVNHPLHAAAWDATEVTAEDAIAIFLFPIDDANKALPENERFLSKAFNLRLRW